MNLQREIQHAALVAVHYVQTIERLRILLAAPHPQDAIAEGSCDELLGRNFAVMAEAIRRFKVTLTEELLTHLRAELIELATWADHNRAAANELAACNVPFLRRAPGVLVPHYTGIERLCDTMHPHQQPPSPRQLTKEEIAAEYLLHAQDGSHGAFMINNRCYGCTRP